MDYYRLYLRVRDTFPLANWCKLLKRYARIRFRIDPSQASRAWNLMVPAYRLRFPFHKKYRVVSLGRDCLIRTLTTEYMIKPDRSSGEKGMIFDLVNENAAHIADFIETDFAHYFDPWQYDPEKKIWHNAPGLEVDYMHETDCGPDDLQKIQTRFRKRLAHFQETLTCQESVLYVFHRTAADKAADVLRICQCLKNKRAERPAAFLVIATDRVCEWQDHPGITHVCIPYPFPGYQWFAKPHRFTPQGIRFELEVASACYQALIRLLNGEDQA